MMQGVKNKFELMIILLVVLMQMLENAVKYVINVVRHVINFHNALLLTDRAQVLQAKKSQ